MSTFDPGARIVTITHSAPARHSVQGRASPSTNLRPETDRSHPLGEIGGRASPDVRMDRTPIAETTSSQSSAPAHVGLDDLKMRGPADRQLILEACGFCFELELTRVVTDHADLTFGKTLRVSNMSSPSPPVCAEAPSPLGAHLRSAIVDATLIAASLRERGRSGLMTIKLMRTAQLARRQEENVMAITSAQSFEMRINRRGDKMSDPPEPYWSTVARL